MTDIPRLSPHRPPVLPVRVGPRPGAAAGSAAPALSSAAHALSAEPPVDTDRVVALRQAIADGTYRVAPSAIADAMIAARDLLTGDRA